MSRKYKFNDKNGVYFISFATVYWIDVFVRDCYFETMMSALNYCRENKGMKIYGYCIMPSHVHLLPQDSARLLTRAFLRSEFLARVGRDAPAVICRS